MNVAFDLDGTVSAFPAVCQQMISALTAAGHHVYILTGVEESAVTAADQAAKRQALTALGIGKDTYYKLVVCPKPHAANKVKALQDNDIEVLFDNTKKNVKKAAKVAVSFLLWNDRQ